MVKWLYVANGETNDPMKMTQIKPIANQLAKISPSLRGNRLINLDLMLKKVNKE
jgi:hypothetical protein